MENSLSRYVVPVLFVLSLHAVAAPTQVSAQAGCFLCVGCFEEYSCCQGAWWGGEQCVQQPEFCFPIGWCWEIETEQVVDGSVQKSLPDLTAPHIRSLGDALLEAADVEVAGSGEEVTIRRRCDGAIIRRIYSARIQDDKSVRSNRITV